MAGQLLNGWAMREAVAKEEDPIFSFPMQPPSHEFRYAMASTETSALLNMKPFSVF